MSTSTLRRAVCMLALAALANPLSAQLTDKQAVAEVKTASKSQLKAFKQNGAAALGTMDATLKTIEGLLTSSSDVTTVASQVANAAIIFMTTMNDDYFNALDTPPQTAALALQSLANGSDLNGIYPKDLYFGTGGVLDAHRKSMAAAAGKVRDAAIKRLAKTAALAEKVAGIALIVELELPSVVDANELNQNDLLGFSERSRFDVILSASKLGTANDGVLVIAGATDNTNLDVNVEFDGPDGSFGSDVVTPDAGNGRFTGFFSGLAEGGYGVAAKQGSALAFDAVGEIGLR